MQINKTVDELIAKRIRYAELLFETAMELDEWLNKRGIQIESEDATNGAETITNPRESAERIREAIKEA